MKFSTKLIILIFAYLISLVIYLALFLGIAWILDVTTSLNVYYGMLIKVAFVIWVLHCLFNLFKLLFKKWVI